MVNIQFKVLHVSGMSITGGDTMIKRYTINPKATTKINHQVIINKPKEIKCNHKNMQFKRSQKRE